jgi:hypothetical protein
MQIKLVHQVIPIKQLVKIYKPWIFGPVVQTSSHENADKMHKSRDKHLEPDSKTLAALYFM